MTFISLSGRRVYKLKNIQELDVEAGFRVDVLDGEIKLFPNPHTTESSEKEGYAYFQLGGDRTLNSCVRSMFEPLFISVRIDRNPLICF